MVYNINNLREAVETAKCMITKEQIDGQKTGQSSASPFMKVNQQNPKRKVYPLMQLKQSNNRVIA